MPNNSLSIQNLKISVGHTTVVERVSLQINPADIVALMGPNGSGKSSLSYALMGHPDYKVLAGKVSIDGRNLLKLTPNERAQAGLFLAFQHPVVVEGVRYERFLWEMYRARFAKSTSRSGQKITGITQFYPYLLNLAKTLDIDSTLLERPLNFGFSGGEKKRLELLQLLLLEPAYAILDEIDSGLDIDAIKQVARGIKLAVEKNRTGILLITHYRRILDYVKPNAVLVMYQGEIVKSGGPELIEKLEAEGYKTIRSSISKSKI
jgi:Fe-S cluster assembly ATP-binding protein